MYLDNNTRGDKVFNRVCGIMSGRIKHGENADKSERFVIELHSNAKRLVTGLILIVINKKNRMKVQDGKTLK